MKSWIKINRKKIMVHSWSMDVSRINIDGYIEISNKDWEQNKRKFKQSMFDVVKVKLYNSEKIFKGKVIIQAIIDTKYSKHIEVIFLNPKEVFISLLRK